MSKDKLKTRYSGSMANKKNSSKRLVYVVMATSIAMTVILPLILNSTMKIPFVYRDKWVFFAGIAYVLLSLLSGYMFMLVIPEKKWLLFPKRDRLGAVVGMVCGPLILSSVLIGLFPVFGNTYAGKVIEKKFTYLATEPYGRTVRGLVELKLIDDGGVQQYVVFDKERVERLALICGDTLVTKGRDSFLGYVIDSEVISRVSSKPCS